MNVMKPLLTEVDAALFDLDGTLVETNIDFPLMKREVVGVAVEYGCDPKSIEPHDVLGVIDFAVHALLRQGKVGDARALHARAMEILEKIELRHADSTRDIPFARDLVDSLKHGGSNVGIVTRNCRKASEISLRIARIQPDVLVCRDDTAQHKPNPEPLRKALGILQARASHSVMVGDHIMDVQSGKVAGLKTIGVLREHHPPDFFDAAAPDFVAHNLREVLDAIVDSSC
jgi:phosphoglycolate phosphatase